MNKIKNTRNFIAGIITTILAAICFFAIRLDGVEPRFLVAGIFLLAWSAVNYSFAFSEKGLTESISGRLDERDQYITMKSGKMTLQILNYLLCAACFISTVLYGIFRLPFFIVVAATLCAVLIALFIIMLVVNMHYEKHD